MDFLADKIEIDKTMLYYRYIHSSTELLIFTWHHFHWFYFTIWWSFKMLLGTRHRWPSIQPPTHRYQQPWICWSTPTTSSKPPNVLTTTGPYPAFGRGSRTTSWHSTTIAAYPSRLQEVSPGNLSTYNTMFIIVGIVTLQYRIKGGGAIQFLDFFGGGGRLFALSNVW